MKSGKGDSPQKTVLFFFGGTGMNADETKEAFKEHFKRDVTCIYIAGCQEYPVGGRRGYAAVVRPDLNVIARTIRSSFEVDSSSGEVCLNLNFLKKELGGSMLTSSHEDRISVKKVFQYAFSRGAVAAFAVARFLHDIKIPVDLIAVDPVPGETKELAPLLGTLYSKNKNLSRLSNIQNAWVLLGCYASKGRFSHGSFLHRMFTVFYSDMFFSQMLPRFHDKTNVIVRRYPKRSHNEAASGFKSASLLMYEAGLLEELSDKCADSSAFDNLQSERNAHQRIPDGFLQHLHSPTNIKLKDIPYSDLIKKEWVDGANIFLKALPNINLTAETLDDLSVEAIYSLAVMYSGANELPDVLKRWISKLPSQDEARVAQFIIQVNGLLNIVDYNYGDNDCTQEISKIMLVLDNLSTEEKHLSKLAFDHYVLTSFKRLKHLKFACDLALFPHLIRQVSLYLHGNPFQLSRTIKSESVYQAKEYHAFVSCLLGSIAFGLFGGGLAGLSAYAIPLIMQVNSLPASVATISAIALIALAGLIVCAGYARKNLVKSSQPTSFLQELQRKEPSKTKVKPAR